MGRSTRSRTRRRCSRSWSDRVLSKREWATGTENERYDNRETALMRPIVLPEPKKEVPTLEEFAPRFLDGHARANRQKPSGIVSKESILHHHLIPPRVARRRPAQAAAVRAAVRLEGPRDGAERRAASLRAAHGPVGHGTARASPPPFRPGLVSTGRIAVISGHREASRGTGGAACTDRAERCSSSAAHVLFAPGDAWCAGAAPFRSSRDMRISVRRSATCT